MSKYWKDQPRSAPTNPEPDERKNNGDLPDTGKGRFDRFNAIPEDWQWLLYDVFTFFSPEMSEEVRKEAWESFTADTRAITDKHAAENGYINFPSGRNLNDPYGKGPMQFKELAFGGNILRIIGETDSTYFVEAFDPTKPAPTLEWVLENKPYLIQWATTTQCYRINDRWDGVESAKHFPQIRDAQNNRTGTPFLLFGLNGKIEFWKSHATKKCLDLVRIESGTKYSPIKKRS